MQPQCQDLVFVNHFAYCIVLQSSKSWHTVQCQLSAFYFQVYKIWNSLRAVNPKALYKATDFKCEFLNLTTIFWNTYGLILACYCY